MMGLVQRRSGLTCDKILRTGQRHARALQEMERREGMGRQDRGEVRPQACRRGGGDGSAFRFSAQEESSDSSKRGAKRTLAITS
jgi:hypothetical protein